MSDFPQRKKEEENGQKKDSKRKNERRQKKGEKKARKTAREKKRREERRTKATRKKKGEGTKESKTSKVDSYTPHLPIARPRRLLCYLFFIKKKRLLTKDPRQHFSPHEMRAWADNYAQ